MKIQKNYEYHNTVMTLLMALFGGTCALITAECVLTEIKDTGWQQLSKVAEWRLHTGTACIGAIAFYLFLFGLELLETNSRMTAWRSSVPWLPLVGLIALATVVHIPFWIILFAISSNSVWAYNKTCSVRRTPSISRGKKYQ
ncbi:MAG: hypothetical protein ACLQM6_06335 [Acidobacteriaceae bacterium]